MACSFAVFLFLVTVCMSELAFQWNSNPISCCKSIRNKPFPIHKLENFTFQTKDSHCRIEAIVFDTVCNKKVCGNPKNTWVRQAIKVLQGRVEKSNLEKC
ncbi:C-C motif chemokine 20-like [Protopterus annectens]|uniref:C-C motif chemokine 20-like n=1 Tax=Protopterus annectens TaxID=7888 RepID=UPI001CFC179F|nr:C-C motif chemokine 20-like [Protopterus annectens]